MEETLTEREGGGGRVRRKRARKVGKPGKFDGSGQVRLERERSLGFGCKNSQGPTFLFLFDGTRAEPNLSDCIEHSSSHSFHHTCRKQGR